MTTFMLSQEIAGLHWLLKERKITYFDCCVYWELRRWHWRESNQTNGCTRSQAKMAEALGCTRQALNQSIRKLVKVGAVSKGQAQPGHTVPHFCHAERVLPTDDTLSSVDDTLSSVDDTPVIHQLHPLSSVDDTPVIDGRHKEKNKEDKEKKKKQAGLQSHPKYQLLVDQYGEEAVLKAWDMYIKDIQTEKRERPKHLVAFFVSIAEQDYLPIVESEIAATIPIQETYQEPEVDPEVQKQIMAELEAMRRNLEAANKK